MYTCISDARGKNKERTWTKENRWRYSAKYYFQKKTKKHVSYIVFAWTWQENISREVIRLVQLIFAYDLLQLMAFRGERDPHIYP